MMTATYNPPTCPYCGGYFIHGPAACPNVTAVEFYKDGTIKRVEKRNPPDFPPPRIMPVPDSPRRLPFDYTVTVGTGSSGNATWTDIQTK